MNYINLFKKACLDREYLLETSETNVFRLFDSKDSAFALDKYNDKYLIRFKKKIPDQEISLIIKSVLDFFKPTSLLQTDSFKKERNIKLVYGNYDFEDFIVKENGCDYWVNLKDPLKIGIYMDMRENREFIASFAKGRRILNTFSFTASFSLLCAKKGALSTTNIDLSNSTNSWAKKNFILNNLYDEEKHHFISASVFKAMPSLIRRGEVFDMIILDPPTFAREKGRIFKADRDYRELIELSLKLLDKEGFLACGLNTLSIANDTFHLLLVNSLKGVKNYKIIREEGQSPDFSGEKYLKFFVLKISK